MAFHDVSLPDDFQYSSQYGAGFATVVQQTASGHEYRIARQAQARHQFRLVKMLQDQSEAAAMKTFALARRGSLHSFRLKDWSDYTSNEDGTAAATNLDCIIGTGDGTTKSFQLVKSYNEGGAGELTRVITLPVAGTVVVAVAAVNTTAFTLTNPGGVITFTAAPGIGEVITAGFQFDVPARFELSIDQWHAMRHDSYAVWSFADLSCIEVLNEVEYPELWYPGGFTNWGAVALDITLSLAQGALHIVSPSTAISAYLPAPPTGFPGGPEVFTINNTTASTIQLRDDTGTVVGAAFANTTKRVGAFVTGGTTTWILY